MNQNIVELNLENFRPIMLEESAEKLVVVYFWTQFDEASKAQLDVIKQFAAKYPDAILLATVDCEQQQEIVQQFGVRGLPTTILVKDGQPVDGFTGQQDEQQLQQTFADHLPKPEDELFNKAKQLLELEDYQQAYGILKQANEINPHRADINIAFADASVETGNLEQAKTLLGTIGLVDQTPEYQSVLGKIELAEKAAESPELLDLQAKHEQNPDDFDIKIEFAIALQQAHKPEQALELMFAVVKADLNYKDAKKTMLDMINALPDGDALKSQYRRKVYSLLY